MGAGSIFFYSTVYLIYLFFLIPDLVNYTGKTTIFKQGESTQYGKTPARVSEDDGPVSTSSTEVSSRHLVANYLPIARCLSARYLGSGVS